MSDWPFPELVYVTDPKVETASGLRPAFLADLIAALGNPPDRVLDAAAREFEKQYDRGRRWNISTRDILMAALAEWGGDESEDTDGDISN